MTKAMKKKADYLPLFILYVTAMYLLYAFFDGRILFMWKHYVGFVMIVATTLIFLKNHKIGVLSLGLTVLLGLFGLLSFSPAINTITIGKSIGDSQISIIAFQPIFVLWAVIHFALSGRYYVGVASNKYWKNIKSDEPLIIE
ncbi:hypothetical protein GWC95_03605 [Sediminibacterium roseum]|uniref:Uncharacterized protein n=1 Tax=Sediminibacterium roseum TaxID=1978412 RepID=A0ABW9ZPG9_9BACT|nr:hypothetical protein [Sediminibacterium roseum]NCI48992.1 hypothetical protein [Sediminibacterium roseum]